MMWSPAGCLCLLCVATLCGGQVINLLLLDSLIKGNATTPNPESAVVAYAKLQDELMNRLVVRKRIPPSVSCNSTVYIYMEPLQLISVDELQQSVHLSHMTDIRWFEPNMTWDPRLYNNITEMELRTSAVWTPRLVLPKSIADGTVTLPDYVTLTFNGIFSSSFSGYISSLCHLDLTYFPFDRHNCSIIFLGEGYIRMRSDLNRKHRNMSTHFRDGGEWLLQYHECSNRSDTMTYVECVLILERRSSFYVANFITPMVFTSAITLIVFWIPAESGEKISFLVSVFVSTSVFLNYIVEMIPRSMADLPRVNILLIFVVIKVIVCTAATAVVLRRYNSRLLRGEAVQIRDGQLISAKMDKKTTHVRVNLPASLSSVCPTLFPSQGSQKDLLEVKERPNPECVAKMGLQTLKTFWCQMSHGDLDMMFFSVILAVSVITYMAILII